MKRSILIGFMCAMVYQLFSTPCGTTHSIIHQQSTDSLWIAVEQLQVQEEEQVIQLNQLTKALAEQKAEIDKIDTQILAQNDTMGAIIQNITILQDELQKQNDIHSKNHGSIVQVTDLLLPARKWNLILQIACLVGMALLAGWFFYISRKKVDGTLRLIQQGQDRIEEQIGLCNMMLSAMPSPSTNEEPLKAVESTASEHSFAIKIADEIARMENNLVRMDPNEKGFKQISKSVKRIKENLYAEGYEIVDMLGKPYDDGMKAIANFVYDETLVQGQQVISSIIKPQINYNGEMIQSSQITVSQNI